jgi:hypothetical protein
MDMSLVLASLSDFIRDHTLQGVGANNALSGSAMSLDCRLLVLLSVVFAHWDLQLAAFLFLC